MNESHKYKIILTVTGVLVLVFVLLPLNAAILTSKMLHDSVEYRKIEVESDAGTVYVHMTLIDRSAIEDGTLVVEPAPASTRTGSTGSVQSIAGRLDGLACINGPYFADSGSRTYPLGFTVLDGWIYNLGNLNRPLTGLDSEGNLHIEVGHPRIFVTSEAYFDPIWLWGINTSAGEDVVSLFDSGWGGPVSTQGGVAVAIGPIPDVVTGETNLEISNRTRRQDEWDGEVVEVAESGSVDVPDGGYVIVFRGRSVPAAEQYEIGTGVVVYAYDLPRGFESLEWITTLGPWFVKNGHTNNYSTETSYGGGITGSAARSAIGLTWNDEIFFAKTTGASLTPSQTADVLIECNVREAVMCDSGSSSGMWVEGIGTIGSSRGVPMGFVVREADESDGESVDELRVWEGRLTR